MDVRSKTNGSKYSFGICLRFPFYRLGQNAVSGRAVSPTVSNFKIPEQSPLNYLLISQIGSNLRQKCANLSGFSAGDATLHNSKANTRMARKSLIPSVLAC